MDSFKKIEQQDLEAKDFGFYWDSIDQLTAQIISECHEVAEAFEKQNLPHLEEEIGDLLNAATSLAIFCGISPSKALKNSTEKFQKRYDALVKLVQQDGRYDLKDQPFDLLMDYWKKAKVLCDQKNLSLLPNSSDDCSGR